MCLFAVDGTWSTNFNSDDLGNDSAGRPVGDEAEDGVRSNTRRFFEECRYSAGKKFYFSGPGQGASGGDSFNIYFDVIRTIEREVKSGNCTEIVMVGWSRGAAIISEITEGLSSLRRTNSRRNPTRTRRGTRMTVLEDVLGDCSLPPIKFVGLFDSVAMIWRSAPNDPEWGEDITSDTEYFAHVTAGDRTGPLFGMVDFRRANPRVAARRVATLELDDATHSGVGGRDDTAHARAAYTFIRRHARVAGVPC